MKEEQSPWYDPNNPEDVKRRQIAEENEKNYWLSVCDTEGLDKNIILKHNYNSNQISVIIYGMRDKVDVTKYANPDYNSAQMREIELALKSGIDITPFITTETPPIEIQKIHFQKLYGNEEGLKKFNKIIKSL